MATSLRHRVSKPISRLANAGALSLEEVRAALAIEEAVVSIMTKDIRGSGLTTQGLVRGNGRSTFEENFLRRHDIRQSYYNWVDVMKTNDLPAGPVLDVIIDGRPLAEIDRTWKKRKGWARAILFSGLRLFIESERREREQTNRLTA